MISTSTLVLGLDHDIQHGTFDRGIVEHPLTAAKQKNPAKWPWRGSRRPCARLRWQEGASVHVIGTTSYTTTNLSSLPPNSFGPVSLYPGPTA